MGSSERHSSWVITWCCFAASFYIETLIGNSHGSVFLVIIFLCNFLYHLHKSHQNYWFVKIFPTCLGNVWGHINSSEKLKQPSNFRSLFSPPLVIAALCGICCYRLRHNCLLIYCDDIQTQHVLCERYPYFFLVLAKSLESQVRFVCLSTLEKRFVMLHFIWFLVPCIPNSFAK